MRIYTVNFRGKEWSTVVDHHEEDPDTNSEEIEWHFEGFTADEMNKMEITEEEIDSIHQQLSQKLNEDSED